MRFYSLGGLKLALKFLQRVEKGIVHVYIIIQFDCEIKVLLGRKVVNDFNPLTVQSETLGDTKFSNF